MQKLKWYKKAKDKKEAELWPTQTRRLHFFKRLTHITTMDLWPVTHAPRLLPLHLPREPYRYRPFQESWQWFSQVDALSKKLDYFSLTMARLVQSDGYTSVSSVKAVQQKSTSTIEIESQFDLHLKKIKIILTVFELQTLWYISLVAPQTCAQPITIANSQENMECRPCRKS